MNIKTKKLLRKLHDISASLGFEIYAVGGFVRDGLLRKSVKDIDFVLVGDAQIFAGKLQEILKVRNLISYPRFGTFMLEYEDYKLEFVNAREESYSSVSRKPHTRKAGLLSDLSRRDFTVNTLAMDLSAEKFGEIIDVYNGQEDLKAGILRTPLAPAATFSDDPLRMMRAIRFATSYKFNIEKQTWSGLCESALRLPVVSTERIIAEFNKILLADRPSSGMIMLEEAGLLQQFLPEFSELKGVDQRQDFHHKDVFYHTLEVLDNIARSGPNLGLRLAALFHDIAKPATKRFEANIGWTFHGHEVVGERMTRKIMHRLTYSNEMTEYVARLVRLHLRPMALINEEVSDSAVRRLIFLAGNELDDLMTLCRADITSKNPQKVRRYLGNYDRVLVKIQEVEARDRLRNFQPPVDGLEIMELFNLRPGPVVGKIKKFVEEAILDGLVPNEHEACREYILEHRQQLLS